MTIYLDCNATTPIDPEVMEVVRHYMEVDFGNAGSRTHEFGLRAKQAVERAREQVAAVVDAKPDEVIFTSGATESNNLAILGLEAEGRRTGKMHIISTQIEHKAVLEPLLELQRRGFRVTLVKPGAGGAVSIGDIVDRVSSDTLLISLMHVNNETGVSQPVEDLCEALPHGGAYLHVDAAQGFGKVGGVSHSRIDFISASAHKLYGPKGVGCLLVRKRGYAPAPLAPLVWGGGQERGLRPGTLPVPLIAGFGKCCELAIRDAKARALSNLLFKGELWRSLAGLGGVQIGDPKLVADWTLCFAIPGLDAEALVLAMKQDLAFSVGSACTSSAYSPSHVLQAMGVPDSLIGGAVRMSWCHGSVLPRDVVWDRIRSLVGRSSSLKC